MSEIKRGAVVLIQAGDPEISGAIAEGIMAGREDRLTREQVETVQAEIDRQAVAQLVKVAVGNTRGAQDYLILRAAAEQDYGEDERGPLGRLLDRAIGIYGLFVYAIAEAFKAQDKVLERQP